MKYQQWKIAQRSQQVCREMERQGVPLLVAATLCARGLTDLDEAKALLSSAEDQLCDPYLMKDMDLATASPPPVCSPITSGHRGATCAITSPTGSPRATA